MNGKGILVSWSGGKDSCLMLDILRAEGRHGLEGLFCTVNGPGCLRMHGVHEDLVRLQAASLGLPLDLVDLGPYPVYAQGLEAGLRAHAERGIRTIAYGDISNHEVRTWREATHRRFGMDCIFPLWGRDSLDLAREIIRSGYRTIVTSVDATRLPLALAGRAFDEDFLAELPPGTDPCGEYGEFHTFVHAGPGFREAVPIAPASALRIRFPGKRRDHDLGVCDLGTASANQVPDEA